MNRHLVLRLNTITEGLFVLVSGGFCLYRDICNYTDKCISLEKRALLGTREPLMFIVRHFLDRHTTPS